MNVKDWLFATKDGTYVIAQTPNWPLYAWLTVRVIQHLSHGRLQDILAWVGSGLIIYWALAEIFFGVNKFRQIVGIVVLSVVVVGLLF